MIPKVGEVPKFTKTSFLETKLKTTNQLHDINVARKSFKLPL